MTRKDKEEIILGNCKCLHDYEKATLLGALDKNIKRINNEIKKETISKEKDALNIELTLNDLVRKEVTNTKVCPKR